MDDATFDKLVQRGVGKAEPVLQFVASPGW